LGIKSLRDSAWFNYKKRSQLNLEGINTFYPVGNTWLKKKKHPGDVSNKKRGLNQS
jgi:hypothetical protein